MLICDCGTNISNAVATDELLSFSKTLPGVVKAERYALLCSEDGKNFLSKFIKDNSIGRVVIAACSPRQHELTFQKVLKASGINEYLLQVVNIREQVAWVTKDKVLATGKAKALLSAAVSRIARHEELFEKEIDCNNDFVVIGSGLSGLTAALELAQKGRTVYLVEKTPWLGGKLVLYEEVFPRLECAPCMLEPMIDKVMHTENIKILTNSEVVNLKGFFGNFEAVIKTQPRQVEIDKCIGCGACYEACPVKVSNEYNGGFSQRSAIYLGSYGLMPNAPVIDSKNCLRSSGQECTKCKESCSFEAINYEMKESSLTVKAGGIVVATGFELFDIDKAGFKKGPRVLDTMQYERVLNANGPTQGKVAIPGTETAPKSIAFVHCAGSRDKRYKDYCSGLCCTNIVKLAHITKKKEPGVKIYDIYTDWCLHGKGSQGFYDKFSKDINEFIRVDNTNDLKVFPSTSGVSIKIGTRELSVDMLVAAPAIVGNESSKALSEVLGIACDQNNFFAPEHEVVSPSSSVTKGIYLAGASTGPKDAAETVAYSGASCGKALSENVPGQKIGLEILTSCVDEDVCGGCRMCVTACPYQAIAFDKDKNKASVNEVLCHGCGVCASGCPSGAITSRNFTDGQVCAEIEGIMKDDK